MQIIRLLVKRVLFLLGYNIYKKNSIQSDPKTMMEGLKRMKHLNINLDIIIDVGAAQGSWTEMAILLWPNAKYELVEPLIEHANTLNTLKIKYPNLNYHLSVAGERSEEVWFNVSSDLDGSGIYNKKENARKVPVITIDAIVKNISGITAIKLDTHGYEIPILKGATETLKRTSLLIIEVYGFYVSPTSLLFHELSTYLDTLDFRLIDIVDIMRRPEDQVFWQADAFYIKKDHPVFKRNSYV